MQTDPGNNLGPMGEKSAAAYLESINYKILDLNFKNNTGRRLGEIDIIALDKKEKELVFIEVKTREYEKYKNTLPEENITYSKLKKLEKIAQVYLKIKNLEDCPYRFDAISVWLDPRDGKSEIKHILSL